MISMKTRQSRYNTSVENQDCLPAKLVGKCRLILITRPMALFFHSGPLFMNGFIHALSRPLVRDSNRGGASSRYRDKFLYGSILIQNEGAPKHGERYRVQCWCEQIEELKMVCLNAILMTPSPCIMLIILKIC